MTEHDTYAQSNYDGRANSQHSYEKAASLAEEYREDLQRLRAVLHAKGVNLPASRFGDNNAELMRFAFTTGLTAAESQAERYSTEPVQYISCHLQFSLTPHLP